MEIGLTKDAATDPKWRQFSANVDRALASWDAVQEWADYIAFLRRLNKVLVQLKGQFDKIPSSSLVALRLASCLHPNLPYGVHVTAIEVYTTVFEILDGRELHLQINVWLPGLLPLMSYASINVKPLLIQLFEQHILPLPSLRNIIRPVLLAFLPGIDDESSESFDSLFKLIEDVKLKVNDDSHFWQSLFLVIISSCDRRPGALVWANRRFPSFRSSIPLDEIESDVSAYRALSYDAQMAATPETGLLIRAFCKGLQDDQLLVQRGFLELLVKNMELQSPVLQVIASKDDLQILLVSACSTVLRKDMSLNRRLWVWLLGPEPSPDSSAHYSRADYFARFALEPLVNGLLTSINSDVVDPVERVRPYRVCVSILDRWEIGASVVPRVLVPIIKSVQRYDTIKVDDAQYQDVVRCAGAFFDAVEAINIWSDCLDLICSGSRQDLELVLFVLEMFNVNDEEMVINHLPLMLLALLYRPRSNEQDPLWFKVCNIILGFIPERAFLPIQHSEAAAIEDPLCCIKSYYHPETPSDDATSNLPFSAATTSHLLLEQLARLTCEALEVCSATSLNPLCTMLSALLQKIPGQRNWRNEKLVRSLIKLPTPSSYSSLSGALDLFITVSESFTYDEIDNFIFSVCKHLFHYLSVSNGNYQVDVVQMIWALQEKLDDKRMQSGFATLFTNDCDELTKARAFSALWRNSIDRVNCHVILDRCLFLVLDDFASISVQHWLESVVTSDKSKQLLEFVVHPITNCEDDTPVCMYHIKTLGNVLRSVPALQSIYVKEGFATTVNTSVLGFLDSQIEGTDSGTVVECLDLLDLTLASKEQDLLALITPLMDLVRRLNSLNDVKSLPQARVLRLLSKALLKLDKVSPVWRPTAANEQLPKSLFQCIMDGLSSSTSETVVKSWVNLLIDILPMVGYSILQIMIPIIELLCKRVTQTVEDVRSSLYDDDEKVDVFMFYPFMDAIQKILENAHQVLDSQESRINSAKSSSDPSFFGNVISGVFAVEAPVTRSAAANDRLTVLLCFQDTTRACYGVWKWVELVCRPSQTSSNSVISVLSPLRTRTRKLLSRLYELETLEVLECLIEIARSEHDIFKVLHVLDHSRPKLTIPHIFNALISRINPGSLEENEKSTITTDLDDSEVSGFLVEYLVSLVNDAIEEIWYECMGFIREVHNNQSLYRHIIPSVLRFIKVMAEKVDAVKFGEQRKVRKDLSDIFLKLLSFALSSRSLVRPDSWKPENEKEPATTPDSPLPGTPPQTPLTAGGPVLKQEELAKALEWVLPSLRIIVNDPDKTQGALANIVNSLLYPSLRQKSQMSLPDYLLSLLQVLTQVPQSEKSWKSLVGDALFDPRFLAITANQASQWTPIISRWAQYDKERIKEYVLKLSSYGTNSNVLFGWSDQESTIQGQNLDRLGYLFLCGSRDGFALNFKDLTDKLERLFAGGNIPHVFTCLRAIILSVESTHLAPVWTFLYSQLWATFNVFLRQEKPVDFDNVLAACKLLDTLLVVNPEDFQM
jgi:hypothetical protein